MTNSTLLVTIEVNLATKTNNNERENRILDAAATLFVHYGFDKSTVSDIAREAGVSKGAIYLHFESKDTLLEKLIIREMRVYGEKWLALIEADPMGGTIAGMYKNSLYALSDSAFMAAMFKQDGRILGNYLHKPGNFFQVFRENQTQSDRYIFVKLMQEAGAMRQDVDPNVIAHIMDMLAYGLIGMEDIKPKEATPPLDLLIEGIANLMEQALAPPGGGDPEAGKEIIRQLAEAGRQQFEAMNASK